MKTLDGTERYDVLSNGFTKKKQMRGVSMGVLCPLLYCMLCNLLKENTLMEKNGRLLTRKEQ